VEQDLSEAETTPLVVLIWDRDLRVANSMTSACNTDGGGLRGVRDSEHTTELIQANRADFIV